MTTLPEDPREVQPTDNSSGEEVDLERVREVEDEAADSGPAE